MIKLSQLHEQRKSFVPSTDDDYFVFGVEVDEELFSPPQNVREIGVLATTTNGLVDDIVMDVLIAYHLAGLDTILEFSHDIEFRDPRHLVGTAAQSYASLSFLPPVNLTDESFEAYCLKLESIARAYMSQQAMTRFVMPVTNYLQHMFLEVIDAEKAKSFVPEDSYVLARFHAVIPLDRSDALKARIRAVIVETAGGEEEFRAFALGMIAGIAGSVETSLVETRDSLRPTSGCHWLMDRKTGDFVPALFDRESLTWRVLVETCGDTLEDGEASRLYRFIETMRPRVQKRGYNVVRSDNCYHLLEDADGSIIPAWYDDNSLHWTVATPTGLGIVTDDELSTMFKSLGPVSAPLRGTEQSGRKSRAAFCSA
jgi:hypothetical protein